MPASVAIRSASAGPRPAGRPDHEVEAEGGCGAHVGEDLVASGEVDRDRGGADRLAAETASVRVGGGVQAERDAVAALLSDLTDEISHAAVPRRAMSSEADALVMASPPGSVSGVDGPPPRRRRWPRRGSGSGPRNRGRTCAAGCPRGSRGSSRRVGGAPAAAGRPGRRGRCRRSTLTRPLRASSSVSRSRRSTRSTVHRDRELGGRHHVDGRAVTVEHAEDLREETVRSEHARGGHGDRRDVALPGDRAHEPARREVLVGELTDGRARRLRLMRVQDAPGRPASIAGRSVAGCSTRAPK